MTNTYSWVINALDTHPIQDSLSDVVYNIHWGLVATSDQTDLDGNAYTAESIGTQTVSAPSSESFTAFENLTQADVEGWLEASELNIDKIKQSLDSKIAEAIAPTNVTKEVPW